MSGIKVGDLVMVMRLGICRSCDSSCELGYVSIVKSVEAGSRRCGFCNASLGRFPAALLSDGHCYAVSRLKKIEPPSESMRRETRRELETT